MNDIRRLLERQARWQRARKALPWPEKIRMAERVRESARKLRVPRPEPGSGERASRPLPPVSASDEPPRASRRRSPT